MRAGGELARLEPRLLAWWAERSIWARMLEKNAAAEPFVLPDRPAMASGPLHAGQALNKVLKDIVVKYRHLSGRRCGFIPGWAAQGLAPERALESIEAQKAALQRLGVFASWEAPYRTVDFAYEAQELRELATLARRGLLYRGRRPVSWCVHEQTVLGEAEVEEAPRTGPSVYVAFRAGPELAERFSSLQGREVFFVTWTSAPWTLPANQALAVNADLEYVFYDMGGRVLCIAKELLDKVLAEVKADELVRKSARLPGGEVETVAFGNLRKILVYASGEELEHLTYQHPFLERTGRVVLSGPVALEAGTGLVHVAPAHGQEEHEVGLRYGLVLDSPVGGDGRYGEVVGPALRGLSVFEAEPVIIGLLAERGALLNARTDTVEQSHPHCGHCHQPVILLAAPRWFIALDKPLVGERTLRQRALEELDRVEWLPGSGHGRIRGLLEGRGDWCISRQRSGGVPLPIASCEGCGEAVVSPEWMERVAAAVEQEGAGVWYRAPVKELLGEDLRCASCGGSAFRRETDVLEAGFGSACMFPAVLERRQRLPAELLLEEGEQLRGWVQASMLVSVGARDVPPYRACLSHGFVVDGQGVKVSGSHGNAIALEALIPQYGAELLRLWAAASDCRSEVRLSEPILRELSQGHAKLRGALHSAVGQLQDFDPARDAVPAAELLPRDARARGRLAEVVARVRQAYESYELHLVCATVLEFCVADLQAVSLGPREGPLSRSARTVMFEVLTSLLPLLAPVLSFTAEEVWQQLPGRPAESVFLADLPSPR